MSRILANIANVDAPDSDYLKGRIRNKSASPAIVGSPVVEEIYGDMIQAWQKMYSVTGITENDLPDNETNGHQHLNALLKFIEGVKFTESVTLPMGKQEVGTIGVNHIDITYAKSESPITGEYDYQLHETCNFLFAKLSVASIDGKSSTVKVTQGGTTLISITTTTSQTSYFLIKKLGGLWIRLTFENVGGSPKTIPFS